jgi:hypothetical protein
MDDVSRDDHWPPPRQAGPEAAAYERECLRSVEHKLAVLAHISRYREFRAGLSGEYPDSAVVVDFKDSRDRAHTLWFRIWDDGLAEEDGSAPIPDALATIVWANVDEDS